MRELKMKKKLFAFLVTAVMLFRATVFFCYAETPANPPSVSAKSALLMDFDSGMVLCEVNAHTRMGMASTTKIMTALTVVRLTDTSLTVTVPKEAVGIEGSSVYLCEGEKLTVEQLLYALLLSSANDAATALAIFCSGSVDAFCAQMNAYAAELGLKDTHFVNPHGLYNEEHYTTAYELALISREALKNHLLRKIFSTYKMPLPFCGEPNERLAVNHNKLLRSYDGALGIKTGFTKSTGRCLVSAAERKGLTLICVTLNAPDDWRDHTALLDYGFENYERRVVADVGEYEYLFPATGAQSGFVTLYNTAPLAFTVRKGEGQTELLVESHSPFVYTPVKKGAVCATLTARCGGETVSSPLTAKEDTLRTEHKKGFWQKLTDIFKKD